MTWSSSTVTPVDRVCSCVIVSSLATAVKPLNMVNIILRAVPSVILDDGIEDVSNSALCIVDRLHSLFNRAVNHKSTIKRYQKIETYAVLTSSSKVTMYDLKLLVKV